MPGLLHSTQEVCGGRKRGSQKHCLLYIICIPSFSLIVTTRNSVPLLKYTLSNGDSAVTLMTILRSPPMNSLSPRMVILVQNVNTQGSE